MLIILKLLFVHLVFDFLLQPLAWIKDRSANKIKSVTVVWHALLHGLFAWIILWNLNLWWVGLIIFLSHWIIDIWKSYQKENMTSYLADQAMHLGMILILGIIIRYPEFQPGLSDKINILFSSSTTAQILAFAVGLILLLRPSSMVVKYFMQRFELEEPDTYALEHAGQWIGYFERIIILLSIMMGAYTVLGFLVASKSLLRFGDREKQSRKHTEYVLLGSLLSWGIGLLVGVGTYMVVMGKINFH